MSNTLKKLLSNLDLQMSNIMSDGPSAEELKAIHDQTRQLTAVSKQVVDIYRLSLDAGKFAHLIDEEVKVSDELLGISQKPRALLAVDSGDNDG
tara:strand:+ start:25 stop:306 length:282 start_codon:yes stop_codon:yes gene_type:complete